MAAPRPHSSISRPPSTQSLSHPRRNLFHSTLTRRPTSATSISTSATTHLISPDEASSEIVVRDTDGRYQMSFPHLPGTDGEEAAGGDASLQHRSVPRSKYSRPVYHSPGGSNRDLQLKAMQLHMMEIEREKQAREMDPAELLAGAKADLHEKVASLDEDSWMFEADHGLAP
ncbi:hypothetical protein MMC25_006442 [Agyrium rufum]|nr:hypothetical protein [Agyrium rufum]